MNETRTIAPKLELPLDKIAEILGRQVDLVDRRGVEQSRNYIIRKHILESAKAI